jgi:hypothetical protein
MAHYQHIEPQHISDDYFPYGLQIAMIPISESTQKFSKGGSRTIVALPLFQMLACHIRYILPSMTQAPRLVSYLIFAFPPARAGIFAYTD